MTEIKRPIKDDVIRLRVGKRFKEAVQRKAASEEKTVSEYIKYLIEQDLKK